MKNFKSSFTPPKNYTFSRSQLDHLKIQCSETLTEIFEMDSNPEECIEIPSFLDKKIPVDARMLPLGYNTERKPSSKRACDWPGWSQPDPYENVDNMRGCAHAFHNSCANVCMICQAHLKKRIEELAPIIQKGLFPGELQGETDESDAANEATLDDNDGTAEKIKLTEMNQQQLNSKLTEIHKRISNINIVQTEPTETSVSTGSIKHCRTCSHALNLHKSKKKQPKRCKLCPDGLCAPEGKSQHCNCQQHLSPSPLSLQCSISMPEKDMVEILLPVSDQLSDSNKESNKDFERVINSVDAIAVHVISNQKGMMMIGVANGSIYLFNSSPHGCKGASVLMGVACDLPKLVVKIRQQLRQCWGANFGSSKYHAVDLL